MCPLIRGNYIANEQETVAMFNAFMQMSLIIYILLYIHLVSRFLYSLDWFMVVVFPGHIHLL